MQYLETPVDDIFALKGKQEVNAEHLGALVKDTQKVIHEIQKHRMEVSQEEEPKKKTKKTEAIKTPKPKKERKKNVPLEFVDMRRASVAFLQRPAAAQAAVQAAAIAETPEPPQ